MVCIFIMLLTAVARLFGVLWFAADTAAVEVPSDTENAEQVIAPPLPEITLADYSIEELCEEITMRGFEISLYKGASNR